MSGKTIALDPEAYEILAKSKRPGETFSAVVKRLLRPRPALSSFAGAWKDVPKERMDEVRKLILASRQKDRAREAYLDTLWGPR